MIEVGALRALRAVAALGTLARAAEELGFTASAVSQQIKRLERQVGVPVLAPAGRGVVLTPAGQAIAGSAPEVFQALERCAEAARSVSAGAPRGTLRVVAFSTAIRGLLAPVVPRLASRCPQLRVELTEQDPDEALHSVGAGTADLALVHDADGLLPAPLPPSLVRRRVHTDVGDVVMSRAHPLARLDAPLDEAALAGHAWVTSPPGTVCHQWFRRLFAQARAEPDVRHLVDDFATQLSLVVAGQVVALIPRLARPPLGEDLIARPLRRPPKREVHAVWRRSAEASPAIRAVLAELGLAASPGEAISPADRPKRAIPTPS
ncbi:LysR family transcriptional regulator [Amycolatopsis mediterranei S699]|uniref:LysR family transcriptional regulator n=2 Tax=Amycolatopsis mediterranei TaxID=33910 RepID=A0A0H3DHK6_AMYMU|nr:LysR family transcriptional regulator [Amycolatopsis mediterranei]ADJ49144.1 LysR family transcriptional regulator [Amycolatopsis mediterranei U32]AEK46105.1 LysR family transcriptional regulator [Amycolatopsis mediterranei S699]AFO80853.1 LysR family transcriptional regulator [Amycolatopsis mediterranei S699]AGT87981.1 LysR family transcriptional regulator [Amycolatopsis mediterranei RB]KDO04125.1 LysR family transcriptional regulator [Amycolatopsis mediterranei]